MQQIVGIALSHPSSVSKLIQSYTHEIAFFRFDSIEMIETMVWY